MKPVNWNMQVLVKNIIIVHWISDRLAYTVILGEKEAAESQRQSQGRWWWAIWLYERALWECVAK